AYIASMAQKYDEGLEKGREEGLEKGKRERELEIAKSLLLQGVDIDIIASTTQLSQQDIKKLLQKVKN
ncbi:MAG: hypothetical protein ACD_16C00103G0001, partial [uncultured bacterium]